MKKLILILTLVIGLCFQSYAAVDLLSCNFRDNGCLSGESTLFYANKNFNDSFGRVLSSNVAINSDLNYNKFLCCKINPSVSGKDLGSLNITIVDRDSYCPSFSKDLMYFTNSSNARVGFTGNITNFSYYSKKMCISLPTDFSKLNIFVSNDDYSFAGYTCLYRTNNITNGLVSACSASFNSGNKYNTIVWAKLIENSDSLKCNSDCTSKLDGRVYEACGAKIADCRLISPKCDGSIYGAYVKYDGSNEVQCSAPWNNKRNLAFTNENIELSSVNNKCSNVIQRKYSVMLNNELVTMSIYLCGGE